MTVHYMREAEAGIITETSLSEIQKILTKEQLVGQLVQSNYT